MSRSYPSRSVIPTTGGIVLEPEEKSALLDAALNDSNTHIWLFMMIGLHTSLRHSENLCARFDRFDARRRQLRVRVKGGRWRDQPLTKTITDILEKEREMVEDKDEVAEDHDRWVFPNPRSRSGHVNSMKKAFRRCVERAGLNPERNTPHILRHTAITEMAETGAEGRTIQAFSGHLSERMVWRYTTPAASVSARRLTTLTAVQRSNA